MKHFQAENFSMSDLHSSHWTNGLAFFLYQIGNQLTETEHIYSSLKQIVALAVELDIVLDG